ncbi:hypothetical protein HDU96_006899 [Phlyctochytrium bullatum]|nr:hypothetical protein HDU96_006899 [Phlyctochytrium bullatum]
MLLLMTASPSIQFGSVDPELTIRVASPANSNYTYRGCFKDHPSDRNMKFQWNALGSMTVDMCVEHCQSFGYPAAGLQYGRECFCDDGLKREERVDDSECWWECDGDKSTYCGAPDRVSLYQASDAAASRILPTFHRPDNAGKYEFAFSAPLVTILSGLTKTNKVILMEKFPFIFTGGTHNNTHAYEFDYSFTDPSLAFREMHLESDAFCGAIHMLPDESGRYLSVAGMRDQGIKGVRLYRPTGGPGVNGSTDWEEDWRVIALQKPRWYPGMLQLGNGSFAVIGGTSDAGQTYAESSIEILPSNGFPLQESTFLKETHPNNLYPFPYVMPSGKILMIADNRAVLMDSATFDVVSELPKIPGNPAGDNGEALGRGGRTYPNSGASVLLPIMPPYNEPVEVMVCGGSEGCELSAIGNCMRIKPEVENSEWINERMPFSRVMHNMVALPDLTFLIVNGAEHGQSGWGGRAKKPVKTAVLYDPFKPSNQRFSILNTTDIARMYHSGAQLLHDGRVLISGSDPLDVEFPEEWRLEYYYPPYLTSGLPRPTLSIENGGSEKAFAYGGSITVKAKIPSGNLNAVRATIISPGSNTHGAHFGQRSFGATIKHVGGDNFLVGPLPSSDHVMPAGNYLLFVLDGPTPSEGQWIRVGPSFPDLDAWPVGERFSNSTARSSQ